MTSFSQFFNFINIYLIALLIYLAKTKREAILPGFMEDRDKNLNVTNPYILVSMSLSPQYGNRVCQDVDCFL